MNDTINAILRALIVASVVILGGITLTSQLRADDKLEAHWTNPDPANHQGTRLYEVECSTKWADGIHNASCSGIITDKLVAERDNNPGSTDCANAWPTNTDKTCYSHVDDDYFKGKEGKFCFATTSFDGAQESVYSEINCLNIAAKPDPAPPPRKLLIELTCDPDCSVEIVQ